MARVPITVMGCQCERCGHEWLPRGENLEPKVCPKCKSPYWDKPKKELTPMSYEGFRDRIKAVLDAADGALLTWTEIRTNARLPQKWPNNQWVRRMDRDIGLMREKDKNGIIRWRLS
ncbi:MAG: hypothetical protein AABZ77_00330 [Chloroflexota bacterium]